MNVKFNAMLGSDIGHWDVQDATKVLAESYELVEMGVLTHDDFRDFSFANAVAMHGGMNPNFFKGHRHRSGSGCRPEREAPGSLNLPPTLPLQLLRTGSDGTDPMNVHAGTIRIAMWSGPRNISTALMRAWENRRDVTVTDEPFYGYYLRMTGADHPGRDDIIASMPTDWREIVEWITGPVPEGHPVWYQKHMTHHILPEVGRDWFGELNNCFLIRDPGEVVASYERVRQNAIAEDLGYPQQAEIFDAVMSERGSAPPVLDSADVLANPEGTLKAFCESLDIPFADRMLHWPEGPRDTDGVWAKHWYASVEASTGFAPQKRSRPELTDAQAALAETCMPHYEHLKKFRICTQLF